MSVALKTPAVFVITCDVCGTAQEYDGGALPAGWASIGDPTEGARHVCATDAARPFDQVMAAVAPAAASPAVV